MRACLVACVITVLAALAAGPAAATTSTRLDAVVTPGVVDYPEAATVSGTLGTADGPLAGEVLVLLARPYGFIDWMLAGSTTSGAAGGFRFEVTPIVNVDYRVAFTGDDRYGPAQADVRLEVRPFVTTSFPANLWLGEESTLAGEVAPAHDGGTVLIERQVGGAWEPLASVPLDADSRFAYAWTPEAIGPSRLRARMEADVDHAAGTSAARLVVVNRPNEHHVPMKYAHYIVIVRHEYRLYYYEHGVLVRGFDVALGRPRFRTPLGYFHIYAKRKPAGGQLGACAMFYRHQGHIAIHGTDRPDLIRRPAPRAFSHGCARMLNRQALWLYERVPVGTRIHNLR